MRDYELPAAKKYHYIRRCGPGKFSGSEGFQTGFDRANAPAN